MTDKQTRPAILTNAAAIGVLRLRTLISAAKLEAKGMRRSKGASATELLRQSLKIKARQRAKVIEEAEAALANVGKW